MQHFVHEFKIGEALLSRKINTYQCHRHCQFQNPVIQQQATLCSQNFHRITASMCKFVKYKSTVSHPAIRGQMSMPVPVTLMVMLQRENIFPQRHSCTANRKHFGNKSYILSVMVAKSTRARLPPTRLKIVRVVQFYSVPMAALRSTAVEEMRIITQR